MTTNSFAEMIEKTTAGIKTLHEIWEKFPADDRVPFSEWMKNIAKLYEENIQK